MAYSTSTFMKAVYNDDENLMSKDNIIKPTKDVKITVYKNTVKTCIDDNGYPIELNIAAMSNDNTNNFYILRSIINSNNNYLF